MKLPDFQQKTAVITGATGALGSHLARALAGQGANLALIGRDQAKLNRLVDSLALPETRVVACAADLRDRQAAAQAARQILEQFGTIDIVLHLVGGWTGGKPLVELPETDLEDMVGQHIWTTFHVIQAFVPSMVEKAWGRLVIVSSPSAVQPPAKSGAYASAKAGQEALMLTLARELQGTGVTANILQVRTIDVERKKIEQPSRENMSWTTPEEIQAAVYYLLSPEGAAVNGTRIPLYS